MSRGPGRVMVELEQRLTSKWTPVAVMASDIYGTDPPTRAQIQAVSRAGRRLQALGRARVSRGWHSWAGRRYSSWVRTPITADETEQARAMMQRLGLPT